MEDLGVFVCTKNEDRFVQAAVKPLIEFFGRDKVLVVDMGSEDGTIFKVESMGIKIAKEGSVAEEDFCRIKNSHCEKNKWAFWVDGDEIYEKSVLDLIPALITSGEYQAYRVAFKYVKEDKGLFYYTDIARFNGRKLYNTRIFETVRVWPREHLATKDGTQKYLLDELSSPILDLESLSEPKSKGKGNAYLWCWHAKLMDRSQILCPIRDKRRRKLVQQFEKKNLQWKESNVLPWEK